MTSIAFAVGVVRLGPAPMPGQRTARDRGAGPRRRGVRRQDRHADRERHAAVGAASRSTTARADVGHRRAGLAGRRRSRGPTPACRPSPRPITAPPGWTATATAPFKSATKWSGTSYGEHGNWVIGAPDVLLDPATDAAGRGRADRLDRACGCCCSARSDLPVDDPDAPGARRPRSRWWCSSRRSAPDARDTLDYFAEQNVSVKVISGDNAASVGRWRPRSACDGETMDARKLPDRPDATRRHARAARRLRPGAPRPETRAWCTPCSRAGTRSR